MEGRSNRHRRAESRQAADVLDRLGGRLQDLARSTAKLIAMPATVRKKELSTTAATSLRPSQR